MKKQFAIFLALILLLSCGCAATRFTNTVTQVSTIDALLAGVYDGQMSCARLMEYGDLGIGTFEHLDGEMILLDGEVYQVKSDGKVVKPKKETSTPFAAVCWFSKDEAVEPENPVNYAGLKALLDRRIPNQNLFCAFKITGRFKTVRTRSVPAQKKPYPPLAQVTAHQLEFAAQGIEGTIVGFRCPPFVKGINVPGYHLHFISDSRQFGGHLLDFEMQKGECGVDICSNLFLILPESGEVLESVDLTKDRSLELKRVEK